MFLYVRIGRDSAWSVELKCWNWRIDLVDFGSPDRDKMHVLNLEPSIALVKSDSCDLILQSANCGVTRGCLWML